MEMKTESMQNMKKVVEKCLDELMRKSDLTPAETKAALDGFKLYDELCCRIEDCKMEEDYSERGYSGGYMPNRQYHITSYGMPERALYSDRSYRRMSYANNSGGSYNGSYNGSYEGNNGSYNNSNGGGSYGYSGEPQYGSRGWYQNGNNSQPMNGSYYGDPEYSERRGSSRHSIGDRVVSEVEKMMDEAKSDYERQELQKYIRTIRAMTMAE